MARRTVILMGRPSKERGKGQGVELKIHEWTADGRPGKVLLDWWTVGVESSDAEKSLVSLVAESARRDALILDAALVALKT